jgi:hypothetical protein
MKTVGNEKYTVSRFLARKPQIGDSCAKGKLNIIFTHLEGGRLAYLFRGEQWKPTALLKETCYGTRIKDS